ncbi:hypothetical protein [Brachybacterium sp. ACRRE]|uniref:hypothetical protein n=1 Tax=Brachybacterium sp. ACRRE TaxID=2918184 RepID=UPI001EF186C1|nr:hypothetical protein [Brachybacterium sp. ACRRE]MCG7308724.1 hypothetical protein [Brachybacterium sp. ACRRE]
MSTTNDRNPDTVPSGASGAPDDHRARRLLAEAEGRSRTLPAAIPAAFITFGMLCVIGAFAVIGLHLAALVPESADVAPNLLVLVFSLVWVGVAMVPLWIFRDRWRRGLGRRWIALMAVWGVLWIAGMFLATTTLAFVIAPLFFVLFVVAVTGEAAALKARSRQGAGRGEVRAR